jgi:hypothetical protein
MNLKKRKRLNSALGQNQPKTVASSGWWTASCSRPKWPSRPGREAQPTATRRPGRLMPAVWRERAPGGGHRVLGAGDDAAADG